MRTPAPILVAPLFAPLNDELIALLRTLGADDWKARAVGTWTVKDVAAHLLDTTLKRLSVQRDRYSAPLAATHGLAAIINEMNAQWVSAMARVSPEILIDMLDRYGRQFAEYMMSVDPYEPAQWAVSWAGDASSPNWFDIARELTEKWHHQQQIRDAAGRTPLYDNRYLKPVIDTFLRALPYAYRNAPAADGTTVAFQVRDVTDCSLVRDAGKWILNEGSNGTATTTVRMNGDTAWRLFTKGLARDDARRRSEIGGDVRLAEPLFSMLAVVA
ncbi:MAG TPA: maleylpyruvate isomerase family mycothiol-dependent enzyme [Thermoanaerobaculia bacterium]